jgi:ribosomal protein S11
MLIKKRRLTIIKLSGNNLFVNITKNNGATIKKFSAGTEKYEGAKKKTSIAKFDIAINIGHKLIGAGYRKLKLRFTGKHKQRKSVMKGFRSAGLKFVNEFQDRHMKAHNGCKKKKQRRRKKRK